MHFFYQTHHLLAGPTIGLLLHSGIPDEGLGAATNGFKGIGSVEKRPGGTEPGYHSDGDLGTGEPFFDL